MTDIILKEESYSIVGICMEIHRELGMGFKEYEFKTRNIPYTREKEYKIG